ncbi:MAG TPA: MFS transporter [Bryobacteraceae bacterium]|nr:MFS transporter [Bryobacteraceae bacterium]
MPSVPQPSSSPRAKRQFSGLRALQSRNYRLFFSGQSLSLIGTWITRIATSWLVYRLSHSAFLLGVVSFAGQIPSFFLAPLAGVWIDRWNRHHTIVATQTLSMIQSLALAALTLTGTITMWELAVLMLAQGVINAFDMPARQSFVIQMIDNPSHLGNAIALNSSIVNAARLVGPAIAGVVIAAFGEGICFLIDGISYGAVIASLLAMRVEARPRNKERKKVFEDLAEGWRYISKSHPIRSILALLALVSLLGLPFQVLMPVFASSVLHGGPNTLGMLMAATGVGALAGVAALANRKTVLGLGRVIAMSTGTFGVALIAFGLSHALWLSLCILPVAGYGMMRQMAASNTVLQTLADEAMRGRVMAFYSMAFVGMAPFGSLIGGLLAERIGVSHTVALCGVASLGGALIFNLQLPRIRVEARPIYVKRGILSPPTGPPE